MTDREEPAQPQVTKDLLRRREWLVREHGQRPRLHQQRQDFVNPLVSDGMVEEPPVVDFKESRQRSRCRRIQANSRQGPGNQDRRALAHHADHFGFGERRSAQFLHQLRSRLGEIARGVDQRAVQVEDNHRRVRMEWSTQYSAPVAP